MNTAHKGRRFEHEVIHALKADGYQDVIRSAASKGVWDIQASVGGRPQLWIQCKVNRRLSAKEWLAMQESIERIGRGCLCSPRVFQVWIRRDGVTEPEVIEL